MNTSTNLSNQEIISASATDAFFPILQSAGDWQWGKSQDNLAAAVQRLLAEHDFVNAVRQSSGLPFEVFRGFNDVKVNGTSQLGEKYYAVFQTPLVNVPDGFSVSENVRLFRDTETTLGHANVRFTGIPSNIISQNGTCEGELVNGFAQRLKEAAKHKRFTEATKASSALTSNWNSGFLRYLQRQIQNVPLLNCIRLELQTQPKKSNPNAAREAESQIQAFSTALTGDLAAALPGYWWKREYRSEIGFSHHVILFWNGHVKPDQNGLIQELQQRWHAATEGTGQLFVLAYEPQNYRTWGIGSLAHSSEALKRSVRLMLAREQYLRLSTADQFAPVGMGKLPAASKSTALSITSPNWKSQI